MKSLKLVASIALMIVASFYTSLLLVHILFSISNLYKLSFVTDLSFSQVFGTLYLITVVMYSYLPKPADTNDEGLITKAITEVCTKALFLLFCWGMAFLAHSIIT